MGSKEAASLLLLSNFSKFYRNRNFSYLYGILKYKIGLYPLWAENLALQKELL